VIHRNLQIRRYPQFFLQIFISDNIGDTAKVVTMVGDLNHQKTNRKNGFPLRVGNLALVSTTGSPDFSEIGNETVQGSRRPSDHKGTRSVMQGDGESRIGREMGVGLDNLLVKVFERETCDRQHRRRGTFTTIESVLDEARLDGNGRECLLAAKARVEKPTKSLA